VAQDHNDIYTIVERLRMLEEGLNANQKSVNQLGATFKPKTVAVLTAKQDPKNPMAGKLVGGCEESVEHDEEPWHGIKDPALLQDLIADAQVMDYDEFYDEYSRYFDDPEEFWDNYHNQDLAEAITSEDVLDKVKRSFTDFIKQAEQEIKDSDLKDKKHEDGDLKSKDKQDRDLIANESELGTDLSGVIPAEQPAGEPGVSIKEDSPVKTITNECGLWEMHGNEHNGFEIRRSGRSLPTRFKTLDEAEMAIEMFAHRQRKHNEAQDYIDEA